MGLCSIVAMRIQARHGTRAEQRHKMTKKPLNEDVDFIRALAEVLRAHDLAEIEVNRAYGEEDSLTVRISRGLPPAPPPHPAPPVFQTIAPTMHAAVPAAPAAAAADPADEPGLVTSPMVGTAYLASEPGAAPFVKVGDPVSEGQTLLIIEAMKTMNQIPSPRAGTVRRILIDDAAPVEFGAALMVIA
jgi:acetyl-CoA carboxylase biotin carboxyl carrier protein